MANKQYCTACGDFNAGKRNVPGSFLVELALWILFLLPGLLYSLWRVSSAKRVCARCGNQSLIPLDSPNAQRLMGRNAMRHAPLPKTYRELGLDIDEMEEAFSFETPQVSGVSTHAYSESHKHDLEMMITCCNAELQAYRETGQVPAPFCFERVALLARKQKKYALEAKVCEQYIRIIDKLKGLPPGHPRKPLLMVDHMADTFRQRLPKAKELLLKQRREAES